MDASSNRVYSVSEVADIAEREFKAGLKRGRDEGHATRNVEAKTREHKMKVQLDHEEVELELSQGVRGGVDQEDKVYVFIDTFGDTGFEDYMTVDAFKRMAEAFSQAAAEL